MTNSPAVLETEFCWIHQYRDPLIQGSDLLARAPQWLSKLRHCGHAFPDKLHVFCFPDRFPHCVTKIICKVIRQGFMTCSSQVAVDCNPVPWVQGFMTCWSQVAVDCSPVSWVQGFMTCWSQVAVDCNPVSQVQGFMTC